MMRFLAVFIAGALAPFAVLGIIVAVHPPKIILSDSFGNATALMSMSRKFDHDTVDYAIKCGTVGIDAKGNLYSKGVACPDEDPSR